ncbi:MAG: helicase-related protein [Deferrisomatales bacterium]
MAVSSPPSPSPLPIDRLADRVRAGIARGPLVVTAPTGSGKSTQVPRWLARDGRVLVVEPRRVACRGLAARVAELEGTPLGEEVGYSVRDDHRAGGRSRIVFATPGIVLRWLASGPLGSFQTVVLDEFHERTLDVDLLLALLRPSFPRRLVVMSATLAAEGLARRLGGTHLRAEGRLHPVEVRHLPGKAFLPDPRGLEERVAEALDRAREDRGDVLVFLPGKGEIASVARALGGRSGWEVLPLHGGLTLEEQSRVFRPGTRRRVILSTNVAETSLTIPGIGVVIDSGLVRRTLYHNGRGFLTLVPVARDSADQRAGRAGRTAPGVCYRLWSPQALLSESTPPEIHREALDPLVLAAAACGRRVEDLGFLDPPKPYAVEAARENLQALGALDSGGRITERGRRLFGLPLDPPLGNLLVEAERTGCLDDAIDLVAALAVDRPLLAGSPGELAPEGCDACALVRALREARPDRHPVNPAAWAEARSLRRRLRRAWNLDEPGPPAGGPDRKRLALTALAADRRWAYVARRRKKAVAWSNGGTEATLGRDSAVDPAETEALVALEVRALGTGHRKRALRITRAMPVPLGWLVEAGIGERELGSVALRDGAAVCRAEVRYAGRLLASEEEVPRGEPARRALAALFAEGQLFPEVRERCARELARAALLGRLERAGLLPASLQGRGMAPASAPPSLEQWAVGRLDALGVESGEDLALLAPEDFLPPGLPPDLERWLEETYPQRVHVGDAAYAAAYDLEARSVTLTMVSGHRQEPPSLTFLPPFRGFRIRVQHGNRKWLLR